jgi:hypothetical protein
MSKFDALNGGPLHLGEMEQQQSATGFLLQSCKELLKIYEKSSLHFLKY